MEVIKMDPVTIGKRLTALRGTKTQEEVAKEIGISSSTLSMYECGQRIPRDNIKIRIASYYNKPIHTIFFEE